MEAKCQVGQNVQWPVQNLIALLMLPAASQSNGCKKGCCNVNHFNRHIVKSQWREKVVLTVYGKTELCEFCFWKCQTSHSSRTWSFRGGMKDDFNSSVLVDLGVFMLLDTAERKTLDEEGPSRDSIERPRMLHLHRFIVPVPLCNCFKVKPALDKSVILPAVTFSAAVLQYQYHNVVVLSKHYKAWNIQGVKYASRIPCTSCVGLTPVVYVLRN